jgi:hypothetical protein
VPVAVNDPGTDGLPGTTDDGETITAYNLAVEYQNIPPVNATTNLPGSNSDYYTREITAAKRQTARWSILATFTQDVEPRGGPKRGKRLHAERPDQLN